MIRVDDCDEGAVAAQAQSLARALPTGSLCVHLSGRLGAGKTTFVRHLLRALGHAGPVKSPTYGLVESYALASQRVAHFDLYRLEAPEELEFLGVRDYLAEATLVLVEWPERGAALVPKPDLAVRLEPTAGNDRRRLTIEPRSAAGSRVIGLMKSAC